MNMNDTPKTDALRLKFEGSPVATYIGELWDFARQIERENAELREACESLLFATDTGGAMDLIKNVSIAADKARAALGDK